MIITYHRAELETSAPRRLAGRRGRIAVAAAWIAAGLVLLGLCYVAAVADLALSEMPDEVSTMMVLPSPR
ncbi:MAG: hypothetical protein HY060_16360 [Proteobacteria bacterium]|nr:hypothetical protein [Pseudomonadota bacterium]